GSQYTKEPSPATIAFWWNAYSPPSASSDTTNAPPTTSECPPKYLVVECTTTSAPSASGCCRYGVAKVLSTASNAPCSCATRANPAMSTIPSNGLVGVSTQISLVFGVIAAATASRSVIRATLHSSPHRCSTFANRR